MRNSASNRFVRSLIVLATLTLCLAAMRARAQMVDLNGNGMSDIWELIYGAGNLNPNVDTDGDGMTNIQEATAGTDPFNPNSALKIATTAHTATNFSVTLPCALGKQYTLQSALMLTNPAGLQWSNEVSVVVRSGTNVTLTAAATDAMKFFRIAVADVDTDGDGVNDWEEYQLGLDPLNAYSNGQLDGSGRLMNDYAYVVGQLANQNVVTLSATDSITTQPDTNSAATDFGLITVTRGGFPLNAVTVNLALAAPGPGIATEGVDFSPLQRSLYFPVGVKSQNITVIPLANPSRLAPAVVTMLLQSGTGYTIGQGSNASVVIYPSPTANGVGLTGFYFSDSSTNYADRANFNPTNFVMSRLDTTVDFVWGTTSTPITNNGNYTVRWLGQVQPQYSETYYFDANTDDGVRVWVNEQLVIDNWTKHGAADSIGSIALQAGVRYDIQMDYFNAGGSAVAHLNWYSPSQSKQIIPSARLFPTNATPAPSSVISPLTAVAFVGQPFSYNVVGANLPTGLNASPMPPGLSFNAANGTISGTPSTAGNYQVVLTSANAAGLGASVLNLQVINSGSLVTREVWFRVPGTNVADIPTSTPPGLTDSLSTLEGTTDFGDNYGERLSGYFIAPATGNYFFWIAGSDSAELWISDDSEPVNKVKRAWVLPTPNPTPPPGNGTAPHQWNLQPNQQSPWLTMVAGQSYYFEVLHKAGVGTNDNVSVAWLQDPTGTNAAMTGVVPGYLLAPFYPKPPAQVPGTLYAADMLAASGVTNTPVGSATMRLSADGTKATISFSVTGLSSPIIGEHVDNDSDAMTPTEVLYDISAAKPQSDGSYVWNISPTGVGTFTNAAQVLELINEGKTYITILTANYPNGELNGHFTLADGTPVFVPPPAAPAWADDHSDPNAASRFLIQATFGPGTNDIAAVQSLGYAGWINNQFTLPATHHLPYVLNNISSDPTIPYPSASTFNSWWSNSITAPDQLRQRVAFALSEIMVVSENGILVNEASALSSYYDVLLDNAFGNFHDLLKAVTLSPAMGLYLNMQGNDAGSIVTGLHADENYAREIQQLFSIGLYREWPDGSLVMNSQGNLVPTYNQNVIMGFASVFTGWNFYQTNQPSGLGPTNWYPAANYTNPMVLVPAHHELGAKLLLDNVVLRQAYGLETNGSVTNLGYYDSQDLESALNAIYNHQNVGPFVCRELIQRLVTSSPSRGYIYRVAQVFNDNGQGVRGDMKAVIQAILLDYEARSTDFLSVSTYGKQREPLLRATAPARAFPTPPSFSGTYSQSGTQKITVTTPAPHLQVNNDVVDLFFTDSLGNNPAPLAQGYTVTVTSPTTFTINAPNLSSGTYTQATNAITLTPQFSGLQVGAPIYLAFTSGGASSGVYTVTTITTSNTFQVTTADSNTLSGSFLLPIINAGGYTQLATNVTIDATGQHGLNPGDSVYINFRSGTAHDGQYTVASVPDPTHFVIVTTNSTRQSEDILTVFPLVAPPLTRSGTVTALESTWNLSYSDSDVTQTPLRAPTVFNFFYPDYKFPGALTAAGLTTPEFQLTSDSTAAEQMNFLESGFLATGNTNGITSFRNNGSIVMNLNPYMTQGYTSATGIPTLVDSLSTLLLAGQLNPSARTMIISYVTNTANFSYSSPPTDSQMRSRVAAVAHLLVTSPDYTIQK